VDIPGSLGRFWTSLTFLSSLSTIPSFTAPGLHSGGSHPHGHDWCGPRGPWDSAIWGSAQPEKDTTSNLEVNRRDDSAYWWSMGGGLVISGGSGRKFGTKMEHCIWKCTRNTCNSGAEKHVNAGEQRSFPATLSSGPPPWWGLLPTVPPLLSPAQWEGESHRPCLGPWICAPATLLHFLVTFSYFHS
jgi:hypothetical protein